MQTVYGFPPIADRQARILILGSMPGKASLNAQQYYAHPRNAFWRIMSDILNLRLDTAYTQRCQHLIEHRIALWDVLKSCHRHTSLDSDIQPNSIICNDFADFFSDHTHIQQVFFNGAAAEQAFYKHVLPELKLNILKLKRLPSSSPAHAALSYQEKLQQWRIIQESR